MGFLKRLFGSSTMDGAQMARSTIKSEYVQIELLSEFAERRRLHDMPEQQRWSRVLPQNYQESIKLFEKQGWLEVTEMEEYYVAPAAMTAVQIYQERLAAEKAAVIPKVRAALKVRDTSEALELRRAYEDLYALGQASWTGPEVQLSHSALTRRIFFLDHWLLEGCSKATVDWLKLYAAEQHLWGVYWKLDEKDIPASVQQELATPEFNAVDAAYYKAYQLALYVDNQETWQRCKGGDHVRRIEIVGPDDAYTCAQCREILGKEFLVARVPDLPPRTCTSPAGCRARYEPVLDSYEEVQG
jgi:hypothetical protein